MSIQPPDWVDTTPYDVDTELEPGCAFTWPDYKGDHSCARLLGHDGPHRCTCSRSPQ